jgi:hypothetical protein
VEGLKNFSLEIIGLAKMKNTAILILYILGPKKNAILA